MPLLPGLSRSASSAATASASGHPTRHARADDRGTGTDGRKDYLTTLQPGGVTRLARQCDAASHLESLLLSLTTSFARQADKSVIITRIMTGNELLRRLRKLGRERGVVVRFEEERGKGSHGTLYFGERATVLKNRRAEIGPGLLHAMLRQLGLGERDLR
jgi:mRNA interferase HicA